jgi:hypothetical protein
MGSHTGEEAVDAALLLAGLPGSFAHNREKTNESLLYNTYSGL